MKGISVVIPTLNRTTYLKRTLSDLLAQEFEHHFEILIVDQSLDPDREIQEFVIDQSNVRYFHVTHFRGLPEARNFGWQHARFDFILYVDDDIQCDTNLLTEHYRLLEDEKIGVVAGGITEVYKKNHDCEVGKFELSTATPFRGFHKKGTFEVDHGGGGNFSTRKDVLKCVNGIDEGLSKGAALYEETDFCLRVRNGGFRIVFSSNAHVNHLAADTGGCRVEEIDRYLYSLVRNRSFIIARHVTGFNKFSSKLYLFRLVLSYAWHYKRIKFIATYFNARGQGTIAGNNTVKCTNWNET